jgi:hypothetical protein
MEILVQKSLKLELQLKSYEGLKVQRLNCKRSEVLGCICQYRKVGGPLCKKIEVKI